MAKCLHAGTRQPEGRTAAISLADSRPLVASEAPRLRSRTVRLKKPMKALRCAGERNLRDKLQGARVIRSEQSIAHTVCISIHQSVLERSWSKDVGGDEYAWGTLTSALIDRFRDRGAGRRPESQANRRLKNPFQVRGLRFRVSLSSGNR